MFDMAKGKKECIVFSSGLLMEVPHYHDIFSLGRKLELPTEVAFLLAPLFFLVSLA